MFDSFGPVYQDDLPPIFLKKLKQVWEGSYDSLYEEGDDSIEDAIIDILSELNKGDDVTVKNRLIYLAWTLCIACKDTIRSYLPEDRRHERVLSYFLEWEKNNYYLEVDMAEEFTDIGKRGNSQNLDEALLVFSESFMVLNGAENANELIVDIIDLCLEGYAIAAGSKDRRLILNWLINNVFPSAFCCRKSNLIYSINTI
jgi:hypothetical protein